MNKKLKVGVLTTICTIGFFSINDSNVELSDLSVLNIETLAWSEYDPNIATGRYMKDFKDSKGNVYKKCCEQENARPEDECDYRKQWNCSLYK